MERVYCRYKIIGGFGLLVLLNGLVGLGTYKMLTMRQTIDIFSDSTTRSAYITVFGLQFLFLVLFATQCRFIIADNVGITFINPLLPFIQKKYEWTDFDYYVTVKESSQHTTHDAVWLIKDKKLKARFSSFYYSNYNDLVDQIQTTSKGYKDFNPFAQLFILLGLKRIKD